jgi:amidohydrolase
VSKTAEAAGATATVEIPYSSHYPVTYNNEKLTEQMLFSIRNAAGANNVELTTATTGAEDFSFYQQKVPGLFLKLGGMPKGQDKKTAAPHHTPDFFIDESSMKTGIKALAYLVVDYMELSRQGTTKDKAKKTF